MLSRVICVAAVILGLGCADAHPAPGRCLDGVCPAGQVCLLDEGAVCVATCDSTTVSRCDNGAVCWRYREGAVCRPGRTVTEGNEPPFQYDCAFGLRPQGDYESEPLRYSCEPVCDTNADCRSGEVCLGTTCGESCRNAAGGPCAPSSHCVMGFFGGVCVNERRFTRIDCDGDRDLYSECTVTLMCDPEDPSRCVHVPEGEE